LLNLARLQGGRIRLAPRTTDLGTLCRAVIEEFATHEGVERIALDVRGACSGEWDHDLLWQAISNLISNALHHGEPDGMVTLDIDGSEATRVTLTIGNRGTIAPDVLPHLFEAFSANSARQQAREGLGLGLHIVRTIAQMHGGTVCARSDPQQGTVFTIELPRAGR